MLNITKVNIKLTDKERIKAYVAITLDECFVVNDMKVIKRGSKIFVAMPSRKAHGMDQNFMDVAHPIAMDARDQIEKAVLSSYALKVLEAIGEDAFEGVSTYAIRD